MAQKTKERKRALKVTGKARLVPKIYGSIDMRKASPQTRKMLENAKGRRDENRALFRALAETNPRKALDVEVNTVYKGKVPKDILQKAHELIERRLSKLSRSARGKHLAYKEAAEYVKRQMSEPPPSLTIRKGLAENMLRKMANEVLNSTGKIRANIESMYMIEGSNLDRYIKFRGYTLKETKDAVEFLDKSGRPLSAAGIQKFTDDFRAALARAKGSRYGKLQKENERLIKERDALLRKMGFAKAKVYRADEAAGRPMILANPPRGSPETETMVNDRVMGFMAPIVLPAMRKGTQAYTALARAMRVNTVYFKNERYFANNVCPDKAVRGYVLDNFRRLSA